MSGSFKGTLAGMKRLLTVLAAASLVLSAAHIAGQSTGASSSAVTSSQYAKDSTIQDAPLIQMPDVEILSDTHGVDVGSNLEIRIDFLVNRNPPAKATP
jgi:hypothetical protein